MFEITVKELKAILNQLEDKDVITFFGGKTCYGEVVSAWLNEETPIFDTDHE